MAGGSCHGTFSIGIAVEEPTSKSNTPMSWLTRFVLKPINETIAQQREYLDSNPAGVARLRALIVMLVAAVALTMRDSAYAPTFDSIVTYCGVLEDDNPVGWRGWLADLATPQNHRLAHLAFWAVWQFLTYVALPALVVKLVLRERLTEYGLKFRGLASGWWIYLGVDLVMAPLILLASTTASFQHTYPFFKPGYGFQIDSAYWPRFWIWQCFYAMQFVSLEFFFRGFMLHGTKYHLGPYCILAMVIPYCMIHYGKPLPETCGAIIAGLVLGFMSLKTRSIWLGAAIHIAVALTMDLAAISQLR